MIKNLSTLVLLCGILMTNAQEKTTVEKDYVAYLFSYFTGNAVHEEQVHYAISNDGYNYIALNDNKPVIASKDISSTGGVRDPHILRRDDNKGFYLVLTDMTSSKGWESNRAMILLKSENLTDWTSSVINIQERYKDQEDLLRVWAPQTVFDKEENKYMVFWSMKHGDGPDIIYYVYANDEFTDFIGNPKPLFIPKNKKSCIDGDIIYKDGLYHLFYKTEDDGNGLKKATTTSLTSGKWEEHTDYKQQTTEAVEGSSIFKLNNTESYILMYDVYMKGTYQFCKSENLDDFQVIDEEVSMNFHPRHGSVISLTKKELEHLLTTYGTPDGVEGGQE